MASPPKTPGSRRQWVAYWLFVFAVYFVSAVLTLAIEFDNRAAAWAVIAVTGAVAAIWFVLWVVRQMRNP